MENQDDEQNIFLFKRRYEKCHIKTTNNQPIQNQKPQVQRWCGSSLYLDIKNKILKKMKTQSQPYQQNQYIHKFNNLTQSRPKAKSKVAISTLKIALDPMCQKLQNQRFEINRKILHKIESNKNIIKSQSSIKIPRMRSAKIIQPQIINNNKNNNFKSNSKPVNTCRKNSKILKSNSQCRILTQKQQNQLNKNEIEKIFMKKNQNSSILNMIKLRKHNSQILKKNQNKQIVKIQNFDTDPLIFYFKVKNSLNASNRQQSIKRIRSIKNKKPVKTII